MASFWFPVWTAVLLTDVLADYQIHHRSASFEEAEQACHPHPLTTLATEQEVATILKLITNSSLVDRSPRTFWVGLRKLKDACVVPKLPLRGFQWTADGSEESQVSRWKEEPSPTCTTIRCAALELNSDRLTGTEWGLISISCKNKHPFICKLTSQSGASEPEQPTPEPEPTTTEPEQPTPEPEPITSKPAGPELKSFTTEPYNPATKRPEPTTPGPPSPTQKPEPEPKLKPSSDMPGSESCQQPTSPDIRSLGLDPDDSSRIHVECWSRVQVELRCSGRPAVWRLPDESPANVSAVCQACQADGVDCKHTCLNIDGSFRCVCTGQDGKHHDADSPVCAALPTDADGALLSGVWLWVVVGVAVLVVLAVVVGVTVKCCRMRRSKKRAMKTEKMAMKGKDGTQKAAI